MQGGTPGTQRGELAAGIAGDGFRRPVQGQSAVLAKHRAGRQFFDHLLEQPGGVLGGETLLELGDVAVGGDDGIRPAAGVAQERHGEPDVPGAAVLGVPLRLERFRRGVAAADPVDGDCPSVHGVAPAPDPGRAWREPRPLAYPYKRSAPRFQPMMRPSKSRSATASFESWRTAPRCRASASAASRSVMSTQVMTTPLMRLSLVRYGNTRRRYERVSSARAMVSSGASLSRTRRQSSSKRRIGDLRRDVPKRPAEVGGQQVQQLHRRRREALDVEIDVEEHRRDFGARQQVHHVVVGRVELAHFVLELTVDRAQLLVQRLQLLLRALHLFVGRLELLVHRHELFVRGFQFLIRALELVDRALQVLTRGLELVFELMDERGLVRGLGPGARPPSFAPVCAGPADPGRSP